MNHTINFIAAVDDRLGIAKSVPGTAGKIPWHLPTDQAYFRAKLADVPVVMGWNTFRANGFKPYGTGPNTVITDDPIDLYEGVQITHDLKGFFENLRTDLWVAGGGQIFEQALPYATHLYLTRVAGDFGCDIFFPEFEDRFELAEDGPEQEENGTKFRFQVWVSNPV
jgi:dihydrofolate reductase